MCVTMKSKLVHYGEEVAEVRVSHSFEHESLYDLGAILSIDMPGGTMFQIHADVPSLVNLAAKILNELDTPKGEEVQP